MITLHPVLLVNRTPQAYNHPQNLQIYGLVSRIGSGRELFAPFTLISANNCK